MRLTINIALMAMLFAIVIGEDSNQWSWNGNGPDQQQVSPSAVDGEEEQISDGTTIIQQSIQINSTEADQIVDHILHSTREGRTLDGFDEVYTDPNIQEALQKGDDGEARNIIKDRLCSLGLMQCNDEHIEGKRPYIAPEELVYAQPVAINPVGRPIPTIPLKRPSGGHYGPPKPYPNGPPPSFNKFGPPPPPPPPHSHPSKYGPPRPSNYGPNKPPRRGYGPLNPPVKPPYASKPFLDEFDNPASLTEFESPYKFEGVREHHKDKNVEVVVNAHGGTAQGGASGTGGVVAHVHHHFHHNGEGGKPGVVVNPIPIAAAAVSTGSSFGSIQKPLNGFAPSIGGGGGHGGFGGVYGGQTIAHYGGPQLKPVIENDNNYFGNSFGTSVGSYGSSDIYKKELNLNSGNSNYLQNYADKYHGSESSRAENYDCVCVPYDQCPTHDIIGRKDDLYLPLDPRNLKTDIEAEEERVITDGNGTMSIVRIPKGASLNATENEESKKVKREAPVEDNKDAKPEARQYGITDNKKIKPTIGISFGLPNQGGGYPINPYGPNPLINPYGGAIGQQGINLGLVSVNPLVSLQVTKDDYGQKVLKPFVNIHVTPNDFLLHKFQDIFAYKKGVFNKHKHYHYHKGYGLHHPPSPHYIHGPEIHPYPPSHHHHSPIHHHAPLHHEIHSKPEIYPEFDSHFHPHEEHEYPVDESPPYDDPLSSFGGGYDDGFYGRNYQNHSESNNLFNQYQQQVNDGKLSYGNSRGGKSLFDSNSLNVNNENSRKIETSNPIKFPNSRKKRDLNEERQAYYGRPQTCGPRHVCCKRPLRPHIPSTGALRGQCGTRHSQGINGRIKNPVYVDGDSEFGEYPWQVAILKKDPKESVYACGGTLIDALHIITAAHCIKTYQAYDLRVRLGEWDVNHDVEFYPYIERDISSVHVHPEFYAGTLYNDIAVLRMDKPVDFTKHPHISPACLPRPHDDYSGTRCWTTGWGKDAFGDFGKYQNILKEVDVPIVSHQQCQRQLQQTRLGYDFQLHPGFVCAGGEEGKDACKGDGGGPMVCERGGTWQVVGVVSWGIGCGQVGVPGVYVKVAHYLDWIRQITQRF